MNVNENENFPRGGKRIIPNEPKRKHENSLFNIEKPHKAKKIRREKSSENNANNVNTEELWQASLKLKGTLTYNKLQEGMIILSCVRHISNLALQVDFPGLTFATITINHISDDFANSLALKLKSANDFCHNGLTNFIKVGQFIPAKVIAITKTEKGHEVQATVNPKLVNSNRKHNSFKKGATVWANMVSELDHGYELTLGVNNCRVFLPFKNVDEKKKYDIGEPLYCIIHKVDNSDFATTLTVSAKEEHLGKCQTANLTLDDVIPGMRVDFLIEEISPKGIKGHFFENCFGYIDETQTFSSISPARLKEGKTVPAYVLFVEPITKVTYLTLRGLQNSPDCQLEIGKVLSAKVTSAVSRGLYLELDKTCAGFVTNKRLLNTLPKDAQLDIMEAIKKKYPVGSCHDCRILDFNYMEQLYICTFEKQLIKEKVFSAKDLHIGQLVTVTIDKIVPNGLVVKSGHVQGFVPNLHLSNVKYSENIKSKFSVGMNIPARILNITSEENVIFTLKQGLIESEKCLTKMEDAAPGSQYSGFVVQAKFSGALIAFYGDVKGWIRNKVLNAGNPGRYVDPRKYFFIGEVVNVWILGLKDNKLQISLNMPNLEKNEKIEEKMKIGNKCVTDEVDNNQISDETNDSPRVENAESEDSLDETDADEDKNSNLNNIQQIQDEKITNKPVLSTTAQSFYSVEDKTNDSESSSDDEQENDTRKRKKKMSAAERAEAAKNEEAKIARIEKELTYATTAPQTAEQFDRLLVANPNSSELWLRYIAMHVAATELEKARAVGRRAIDTINMTLVKEKFNVWIALLHLENMYGTKQSFEELFEEAVKYNDALDIYLSAIKMFASSEKLLEMEEKIKKLRAKEKQNPKMWLEVGRVYYGLKKCKEARNIKEAAIKSILDKKRQFDLIMRFGIMEFQLGDLEHAIANFETILETYPTKVNIWLIYVDQLVKQNKIELARKVLERAVHQTFNVKTMKILFQKFIIFEEQHGISEAIDKVKSRAKEYLTGLGVK